MANQVSMIIGNALHYRQGLDRSRAMRTAWAMLKQGVFYTRLAGVTFGLRQTALLRLKRYSPEAVKVALVREDNPQDGNAVAVMVAVAGGRPFKVGYLPRSTAALWAGLVGAGRVAARLERVTGGNGKALGAVIRLELAAA